MQFESIRKEIEAAGYVVEYRHQTGPKEGGYTTVAIRTTIDGRDYSGHGNAKYNPNDSKCPDTPFDLERGYAIAISRAKFYIARAVWVRRVEISRLECVAETMGGLELLVLSSFVSL